MRMRQMTGQNRIAPPAHERAALQSAPLDAADPAAGSGFGAFDVLDVSPVRPAPVAGLPDFFELADPQILAFEQRFLGDLLTGAFHKTRGWQVNSDSVPIIERVARNLNATSGSAAASLLRRARWDDHHTTIIVAT